MKPVKITLRFWIAFTSILSFLGGWALFSHAGKPAPLIATTTDTQATTTTINGTTTLAPIPSLDQLVGSSAAPAATVQQFAVQPNVSNSFTPRLRSRGS